VTSRWREIADRILAEVEDLNRVTARAVRFWRAAGQAETDRDVYLDAVALNLQSFYSGAERLFELIAHHVDGAVPVGETWHRDLLRQMGQEMPGRRPAVISEASTAGLEVYRRFRHLVRNVYATDLVPERMAPVVDTLPKVWVQLQAELLAFAGFLAEAANPCTDV
jgi:hypothetical protein